MELMENDKLTEALQCCACLEPRESGCSECPLEYGGKECEGLCGAAWMEIIALRAQLAEKDKQLAVAVEESDFRKQVELTPLYTCGGHDYLDDDDEDFWCPVCHEHLGRNRHETICPRCGQAINSDAEPCWDYAELRRTEYDRLPKSWERGPQEAGEDKRG